MTNQTPDSQKIATSSDAEDKEKDKDTPPVAAVPAQDKVEKPSGDPGRGRGYKEAAPGGTERGTSHSCLRPRSTPAPA
jgi:hypothetical protein